MAAFIVRDRQYSLNMFSIISASKKWGTSAAFSKSAKILSLFIQISHAVVKATWIEHFSMIHWLQQWCHTKFHLFWSWKMAECIIQYMKIRILKKSDFYNKIPTLWSDRVGKKNLWRMQSLSIPSCWIVWTESCSLTVSRTRIWKN